MPASTPVLVTKPKSPSLKGTILPFIFVIALQLLFAGLSVATLSGIRVSLSVAGFLQNNYRYSTYYLDRYSHTGDSTDLYNYTISHDLLMEAHEARSAMLENDNYKFKLKALNLLSKFGLKSDAFIFLWLVDWFKDYNFIKNCYIQFDLQDNNNLKIGIIANIINKTLINKEITSVISSSWSSEINKIQNEGTVYFSDMINNLSKTARIIEKGLIMVNFALAAILAALTIWRVKHFLAQRRSIETTLAWQASHDTLTGIANRRAFEQRLDEATRATAAAPRPMALMFVDLDQFKIINDTCGHAAGDALLRRICAPLQSKLGGEDLLARLGGDEFSVLIADCTMTRAVKIANAMRAALESLDFVWGLRAFKVTASIGLAHSDQGLPTAEDLMRAADMACYMAKEKGRNRVHVHTAEDQDLVRHAGEMNWVQRIHQALNENRFCLYAQDIAPLGAEDEDGMHLELLIRLQDETGAVIPPASFLPAAERFGLMTLIDRWVVRRAFEMLSARKSQHSAEPIACCAINLSGATIGDDAFLAFLTEAFAEFDVPPHIICFEITETSAITNLAAAQAFINNLRAIGCRFSLDDFGAGMSSFAYLKHFPVDFLKIDGGFVKNLLEDKVDRAMVEMINHIGHVMGKRIIAEFVENDGLIAALGTIGVDYGQGYGIGRPRPFDLSFRSASWVNHAVPIRKVA